MPKMEIKGIVEEPKKSLLDLAYEAKNTLRPLRLPDTLGKPAKDKAVMAMDACVNNIWNKMYRSGLACSFPQFLGYGTLSNVAQDGLVRSIVETLSDDMTRKGVEFTSEGESDKADQINQLEELMRKYKVVNIFNDAYNKCGYFGGCLVYIDMGYLTDAEKAEPLVLDKDVWARGKFRGFKVIEPCNVSPGLYNATDPTADEYFNPETWFVLGKTYHKSRFLYFSNNEVPLLLKPAYNFFGIATSQIVLDYIVNFTKNRESAQRLLNKFSLLVYKTNMSDYLSGGECTSLQKRTKITATQRDNDSIVLLDKDMEEFEQINTPIGGVSELVQMSLDLLATIAHRPKTILFGDVPKGLSSNDDGSIRAYYDYVLSQNNKIGRNPMEKVLKILELEALGDIDNEIGFKFKSLWEMDDKEVAELNNINAQKDVAYITSGVLSPEEVRKSLANNPNSGYSNIDVEDIPEQPEDDMQGEEQTIGDVLREQMAQDAEFVESEHPRDADGKFTDKPGSYLSSGHRGRGYVGHSMSVNMAEAQANNELPASKAAKKLGVSIQAIKEVLSPSAWHHSSSWYNKVDVYDVNPYLDLKEGKDLSDDYDEDEVAKIMNNWEKMKSYEEPEKKVKQYYGDVWWTEWSGTRSRPKATEKKFENILVEEKGSFYFFHLPDGTIVKKKMGSNGTAVISEWKRAKQKTMEKARQDFAKKKYSDWQNPTLKSFEKYYWDRNLDNTNIYLSGQKPFTKDKPKGLLRIHSDKPVRGFGQLKIENGMLQEWNGEKWIDKEQVKDISEGSVSYDPYAYEHNEKMDNLSKAYTDEEIQAALKELGQSGKLANDEWITVHPHGKEVTGNPVFVEEGETKKEAIDRRFGKKDEKKELEEFKNDWENKIDLPYKSTKDIEKAFGKSKKVLELRYDRERYFDAYRNFKEKQDVETMKELKQRFEELKNIYNTLPALEEKRRQEKAKHIENTEKGAKTAGFEIVKETPKAILVKKDKKTLWLPRSTIHADGTLTPRGEKLFEHELTDKQKEWAKEQRKIRWKEGVPNNYTCERGKAYAYSIDLLFPALDTNKSVWVFIPKSVIQENGNIPHWILEKKYDELRDYYRNRGQFMITDSPFTTGALQSWESREDIEFEEELYNKAKSMAFDKALYDDDVTIVDGKEVKLKDIDNFDDIITVPTRTWLDVLKDKFRR